MFVDVAHEQIEVGEPIRWVRQGIARAARDDQSTRQQSGCRSGSSNLASKTIWGSGGCDPA